MKLGNVKRTLLALIAAMTISLGMGLNANASIPPSNVDTDAIKLAVAGGDEPATALANGIGDTLLTMVEEDEAFEITESELLDLVTSVFGTLQTEGMSFPDDIDLEAIATLAASLAGVEPATGAGPGQPFGQTIRNIARSNSQDKNARIRAQVAEMVQQRVGDNGAASGI